MTTSQSSLARRATEIIRKISPLTWIGIGGTLLLAVIAVASTGIWGALMMVALVLLITAVYAFALRRSTWLRLPRKRSTAAIGVGIAFAVLIGSSSAYGAVHPVAPQADSQSVVTPIPPKKSSPAPKATPKPTHVPVVTTKDVSETTIIPFASTSVQDAAKAQGTSAITTVGANGVNTKTYTVTYSDGTETARVLTSDVVTTPPVSQVTAVGTYVAPPPPPAAAPAPAPAAPTGCTNGTYVNSAGTTVCSPEVASSAPAGATAKCNDGTYSFSQSRRGTCSSHGGVAAWL